MTRPLDALLEALHALDPHELQWLSGYAAGLAAHTTRSTHSEPSAFTPPTTTPTLTASTQAAAPSIVVLFATQTGNSERVARDIAARLQREGAAAVVRSVRDVNIKKLPELAAVLVVVTSTHGDGDPPDELKPLYDALHKNNAPRLEQTRYAVVGLGDSSYRFFCKTAHDLDALFASLGATRIAPLTTCDLDIDKDLAPFFTQHLSSVVEAVPQAEVSIVAASAPVTVVPVVVASSATVIDNHRLTARGALKDVRHIELSLAAGVRFTPGDALLVHGTHRDEIVKDVVAAARIDADDDVMRKLAARELTRLTVPLVRAHAERVVRPSDRNALDAVINDANAFSAWAKARQLTDLLLEYNARWTAADLLAALRPLQPRAYSIANSLLTAPGEAHLTVAVVDDHSLPRRRRGALSGLLQDAVPDATFVVEVQENPRFRLPKDDVPLIFIGPGTGIAPFRAFLQERRERGAVGKNWLFFGDHTIASHFLYQREWSEAKAHGALHRLDVAFSRDQENKLYVQHRIAERGQEFWRWLDDGAHLYICGDASRMAKDVERAVLDVIRTHGGKSDDDASAWLAHAVAEHRYQKDVY